MSYEHDSEAQSPPTDAGADQTEVYQPTAEWNPPSDDGDWEDQPDDREWEDDTDHEHWDPDAWDDDEDEHNGAANGAKHALSDAAGRITRWFAGDREPEYDEQHQLEHEPQYAHAADTPNPFPTRERAFSSRRAAADRAIAANARRRGSAGRGGTFPRGASRAARVFASDHSDEPDAGVPDEPGAEPLPELMGGEESSRFPVAPLGYSRQAVDEHVSGLERQLDELRAAAEHKRQDPSMSVQEELERIGEQTASILIVAHDKANETTRQAQEQAERCIADAAANAVAITEEAKAKLRELERETEALRKRREQLIADIRHVSGSLGSLADEADTRFPEPQPAPEASLAPGSPDASGASLASGLPDEPGHDG